VQTIATMINFVLLLKINYVYFIFVKCSREKGEVDFRGEGGRQTSSALILP
jgi:hypothetical protein